MSEVQTVKVRVAFTFSGRIVWSLNSRFQKSTYTMAIKFTKRIGKSTDI